MLAGWLQILLALSTEFFELAFQLRNPGSHRADAHVVVSVNLLEPFEFRLRRDVLPLQGGGRFHHGFALFLDVDRSVLARELTEVLLRRLQILAHGFQPLLQKDALPPRR